MAVTVIAGAVGLLDVALALGIALYAVRQLTVMTAPLVKAWGSQWMSPPEATPGVWQSAKLTARAQQAS